MRATPPVRFCISRTLFFGLSLCLLFLTACQTTSLTLDPRFAKALGQPQAEQTGQAQTAQAKGNPAAAPKPSPKPIEKQQAAPASSHKVLAEVSTILDRKSKSKISPEALLEAEGNMNIVEQSQEYDPAAEHMKARSGVDTGRKTKSAELAPHFDPDVEEHKDKTFRVLKIQKGDVREGPVAQVPAEPLPEVEIASAPAAPAVAAEVAVPDPAVSEAYAVSPSGGPVIPVAETQTRLAAAEVAEQPAGAVIIPGRKPVAANATIAQIEPAAGAAQPDALSLPVVPGRKPAPPRGAEASPPPLPVSKAVRPKPTFMPVKLKPLREDAEALLSSEAARIVRMRSGEDSGRTRVVFEVRGDVRFEAHLDNGRKLVRVDLEGADWAAGEGVAFHELSVVRGFRVERLPAGGTQVLLELKKDTKLLQAASLGTDKAGITRIVIDLRNG